MRKPSGSRPTPSSPLAPKPEPSLRVVGKVEVIVLTDVKPNTWNPNRLTKSQSSALRQGLQDEGWVSSQAMLIWGSDEHGEVRNVIIDGEHRWEEALSIGFTTGPAVLLHGLTEAEAKAFTIKLDGRRGSFDWQLLAPLVVELQFKDPAAVLGFSEAQIGRLLEASRPPEVTSRNVHAKMVPLFFDNAGYERFNQRIAQLAKAYGTANVTDTVLAGLQHVDADSTS